MKPCHTSPVRFGNAMRSMLVGAARVEAAELDGGRVRGDDGDVRAVRRRASRRAARGCRDRRSSVCPHACGFTGQFAAAPPRGSNSRLGAARRRSCSGALRDERAKERGVALRGPRPADVGGHRAQLHAPPRHAVARSALARPIASSSWPRVTGANWMPVPAPAASAISLASTTVSARPPTRATIGMAP